MTGRNVEAQGLRPGMKITDASGAEYVVERVQMGPAPKGARIKGRWAHIWVAGKDHPHRMPGYLSVTVVADPS